MIKTIIAFASILALGNLALASKARVEALGDAAHLNDFSKIFSNPSDIHSLNDQASFEFGGTPVNSTPNAEGGILKTSTSGVKYGLLLGKQVEGSIALRQLAGTAIADGGTFLLPENSFEFFYGAGADLKWGASFHYAANNKASLKAKSNEMAASFGFAQGDLSGYVDLGLGMTAEGTYTGAASTSDKAKFTETPMALGASYTDKTLYYHFDYASIGSKAKNNAGTDKLDYVKSVLSIGVISNYLVEQNMFFYGFDYVTATEEEKTTKTKTEGSELPFIAGMESTVTPWLVARGSVKQNILLGSSKTNGGEADSVANNTTVAAGLGFKFGKLLIDGVLCANVNGVLGFSAGSFTQRAALTYNF